MFKRLIKFSPSPQKRPRRVGAIAVDRDGGQCSRAAAAVSTTVLRCFPIYVEML